MRKLFWLLTGLLTAVIVTLAIAPRFIDWNLYKNIAEKEIIRLTGRDVKITGQVGIALWPKPAFRVEGITLSGISGGQVPYLATSKSLEAGIALAPLLSGKLRFEHFKLLEPIIELERLANGRVNWDFTKPKKSVERKTKKKKPPPNYITHRDSGPQISFDHLTVLNGVIIYRDAARKKIDKLEEINATIIASSLDGPIEAEGTMVYQEMPLSYSMSLGSIIQGRSAPFRADLSLKSRGLTAKITGSVVKLSDMSQFRGRIDLKSKDVGSSLFPLFTVPPNVHTRIPLELSGQLLASSDELGIVDLRVKLLNILAEGDLQIDLTGTPRFSSQLAIKQVDLDKLSSAFYGSPTENVKKFGNPRQAASIEASKENTKGKKVGELDLFSLLKTINGSAIITVDKLTYKSELVHNLLINMELKDKSLLFRQVSAEIPGSSDVLIQGQLVAERNMPKFIGNASGTIENLPNMVSWLSAPSAKVLPVLPRQLSFASHVSASPEQIKFTGFKINFDKTQLRGAVKIGLGERKRRSLDLKVFLEHFDIDAYFPSKTKPQQQVKNKLSEKKNIQTIKQATTNKPATNLSNAIGLLHSFDANFQLQVKSGKFRDLPVKDLVAEGKLDNGVLGIKRFDFQELAGAAAKISGTLEGFDSIPQAKNIKFNIKIPNLMRHSRVYGTNLSPIIKRLKGISLNGRLNGNLIALNIDMFITAAGAKLTYRGQMSAIPSTNLLNGKVTLRHASLPKLLRRIGINYRPARKIGGINLASDIVGSKVAIEMSNFKGQIGKTSAKGAISVHLASSKPLVKANLTTGAFDLESFLPTQNKAFVPNFAPLLLPASWQVRATPVINNRPLMHLTATPQRWSKAPLNLSSFYDFNADIRLKAPIIIYDRYLFEKITIIAKNRNGVLNISHFKSNIFGGSVSGNATLSANRNRINSSLRVNGINLKSAFYRNSNKPVINGKMRLDLDFNSAGESLSKIISATNGKANFTISDINLAAASKDIVFSKLLDLLTQGKSPSNQSDKNTASINGSFKISHGIATTHDMTLISAISNARASGNINFANKTINFNGHLAVDNHPLAEILKSKVREVGNLIPFAINGPWENPRIHVDTRSAFDHNVLIPKANKLLKKAPKKLQNILEGVLGGVLKPQ